MFHKPNDIIGFMIDKRLKCKPELHKKSVFMIKCKSFFFFEITDQFRAGRITKKHLIVNFQNILACTFSSKLLLVKLM